MHFVDSDVEVMTRGITVSRLNGPGASQAFPDRLISWDDRGLVGFQSLTSPFRAATRCGGPPASMRSGTLVDSSPAGFLAFGEVGGCTSNPSDSDISPSSASGANFGTWGNLADLDRWANVPSEAEMTIAIPATAFPACTAGTVYAQSYDGRVATLDPANANAWIVLSQNATNLVGTWQIPASGYERTGANGLALADDGTLYGFARLKSTATPNRFWVGLMRTNASGSWERLYPPQASAAGWFAVEREQPIAGAVDLSNGRYLFGGWGFDNGASNKMTIYEYDGTNIVTLGQITTTNWDSLNGSVSGDFAFDAAGNLYVLRGDIVNTTTGAGNFTVTTVSAQALAAARAAPGGPIPSSTSRKVAVNDASVGGIAVMADGALALANQFRIWKADPVTFQVLETLRTQNFNPSGQQANGGGLIQDLASCASPTTLSVEKNVEGRALDTDQFTLQLRNSSGGVFMQATTSGQSTGAQAEKVGPALVTVGGTYQIAETAAGATADLANYTVGYECTAPGAADPIASGTAAVSANFTIPASAAGKHVTCTFTNTPKPTGSVSWQKVQRNGTDATVEYADLAGSEWRIVGPTPSAAEIAVIDCEAATAAGCSSGPDRDHRRGHLRVAGLLWGDYQLIETKAPAGFQLDATPILFAIGQPGSAAVKLDWDLGKIENTMVSVPGLPLTGGLGEQVFWIIAALLSLVAVAGGAIRRRPSAPSASCARSGGW